MTKSFLALVCASLLYSSLGYAGETVTNVGSRCIAQGEGGYSGFFINTYWLTNISGHGRYLNCPVETRYLQGTDDNDDFFQIIPSKAFFFAKVDGRVMCNLVACSASLTSPGGPGSHCEVGPVLSSDGTGTQIIGDSNLKVDLPSRYLSEVSLNCRIENDSTIKSYQVWFF